MQSSNLAGPRFDPGRGLGVRAKAVATLVDFPYHDIGLDKYLANRTYTPLDQGTYFGKLIARNPFYQNRPMRIRSGFITDPWDWNNFQTRRYNLEEISGPDKNGRVRIVGKDILKLAEDKRAKWPPESRGTLSANITAGATSLNIDLSAVTDPATEYPTAGGRIRMGDEIIDYGARSGSNMTSLTRAVAGTVADSHDAGAIIQICKVYTAVNAIDIVEDILKNGAGIDASFIPSSAWATERDTWLAAHKLTRTLSEPTGVNELIVQLTRNSLFYIWWHEIDQEIRLRAIRPPDPSTTTITDAVNVLQRSAKSKEDPAKRISRVLVWFDPRNQLEVSEPKHFKRAKVLFDADAESSDQYGEKRTAEFFVPWFAGNNAGQASALAGRLIARYRDNPKMIDLDLDAKDSALWTGDLLNLESEVLQDADGSALTQLCQVISVRQNKDRYNYQIITETFAGRYGIIGPNTLVDYSSESEANKDAYGFIAPASGNFPDAGNPYKIL